MSQETIYALVIEHSYGTDVHTFRSKDAAVVRQANYAREWWKDRRDQSAPDDHTKLTDAAVIAAYFDENEREFAAIHTCNLED